MIWISLLFLGSMAAFNFEQERAGLVEAAGLQSAAAEAHERERAEAFAASALAASARYNREAAKLAERHARFQHEFGEARVATWAAEQLSEHAAAPGGCDGEAA